MLRNPRNVKTYFPMILVTIAVIIILPPLWMKLLLVIVFMFILKIWLEGLYETILGKQFLIMLKKDEEIRYSLKAKAVNQFWLPGVIVTGLLLVIVIAIRLG